MVLSRVFDSCKLYICDEFGLHFVTHSVDRVVTS